jgi:glycosyltransferase involved in cell wall biosynthesis
VRVAIVHDFMETYCGAERVTEEMARAFPAARVTAILGRPSVARRMGIEDRFASVLPPRPRLLSGYRALTPLFPAIVRANAIHDADVLLSSSYAFAHFFRPAGEAPHVCYCHSPLRFAWSMTEEYRDQRAGSAPARVAFEGLAGAMRRADAGAARRVDRYLTQSPYVAGLIERAYHRSADVIGAPVDCDLFRPAEGEPEDFYLLCGRLIEPYKRMDIVLEAFASLPGKRLVVAGDGPAMGRLRAIAPANVEFRGHLADTELVPLMQRCAAAIFPSVDDFGLIPVEVAACGRPVLAYAAGGALHTVRAGVTGEFFHEQSAPALFEALRAFEPGRYDPHAIRRHALHWDAAAFRERLVAAVRETVERAG